MFLEELQLTNEELLVIRGGGPKDPIDPPPPPCPPKGEDD